MASDIKKEIKLEIAHVLFMDIVGYSKLLIDEQRKLLDTLNQIVRNTDAFREADAVGRLIKIPTGDGMALVFRDDPEAPVECALQISRALKVHPELPLRIGVHSGPVSGVIDVNERANVAGAGINMAQRVMDCGDAGHILLSKHVAEDLEQYARWKSQLHDLGECEVKHGVRVFVVNLYTEELGNSEPPEKFKQLRGISAPISASTLKARHSNWAMIVTAILIVVVLAAGILIFLQRPRNRPGALSSTIAIRDKSIAVLPFENLSEEKANAYFADGIQDEILTRLSKIADLKVISRTSTQHYKSAPENLPQIAKQLGVAHILEGSVQKSRDAVRINVQLIKAADDSHLWAETFDRKLTDCFSVESEVAKAIADTLRAKLTGTEEQVIAARPTDKPEAYDAYLRGLTYSLKAAGAPSYIAAQKYLRESVRLDPKFARAWALLAEIDAQGYITTNLERTDALREEARQAAETALGLQPNLGEALLAKGAYYYSCLKDYDTAGHYFMQGRQFLPNDSRIPEYLALIERRRGHWDQCLAYFDDAERLDPRNVEALTQNACSYVVLRRFPEALRKFDQILNIVPDDVDMLSIKAGIAQVEGDLPRAAALLAPLKPRPDDVAALETQVYQAILERHPAQIIPRLKETLANPDPTLGFLGGELRFWLGWAQEVAGDQVGAYGSWRQARGELEPLLREQSENLAIIVDLALINMFLGDKSAAFSLAERGMATNPLENDAMDGPVPIEVLARVSARLGEPDRAIASLTKLLSIPGEGALASGIVGRPLTPALLRLDPMFDPLRNDPRFEKLAHSK